MTFVNKITTNIKSPDGLSRTTELGKHTLLIGPNESGKSTIAEAVQLALTGSVSGILYREKAVKSTQFLGRLMPEGSESVDAKAELDDGGVARWSLTAGKTPKSSGQVGHTLPITELKSLMASSDAAIRSFFYAEYSSQISVDFMDLLPQAGLELFQDRVKTKETDLNKLITLMGKRKRENSSLASASQTLLQGMEVSPGKDLTPLWDDLEKAQKLTRLRNMYQAYSNGPGEAEFKERAMAVVRDQLQTLGTMEELKEMDSVGACREKLLASIQEQADFQAAIDLKEKIDFYEWEVGVYSELESELRSVRRQVLIRSEVWEKFSAKVNEFLPASDVFELVDTLDSKRITMGLLRENGFHQALSGSTEARTLGAMSAAIVTLRGSISGTTPAVIILDDRMWDMKTLAKTMTALEKVDCQVIIMSTSKPRGKPRKLWSYVEVGALCPTA